MTTFLSHAETFDTVIVGGGSSGCALAAELAQEPGRSILVLESGDRAESHPETLTADGYKRAFLNPRLMWERFSEDLPGAGDRPLYMGSGHVVGGGGSVNAMVYTRGDAADYDDWGLPGWRWNDLVPHFEAIEARLQPTRKDPTPFTEACIAAAEHAGFARKVDLNDGDLCGYLGYEWMNQRAGQRRSAYTALLAPVQERVELRTGALVRRVLFEGRRAVGVEVQIDNQVRVIAARREVIMCAGALETPRILLLSGVGPGEELRRHGISQVAELPVGRNFHDHPNVTMFYAGRRPTDTQWAQLYGFHRAHGRSTLPSGMADTCYVFYSARSSLREAALKLGPSIVLPMWAYRRAVVRQGMRGAMRLALDNPVARWCIERLYGVVVILGKPRSRGTITLRANHPEVSARIDPAYLADPEDMETMVQGVRLAQQIANAPSLAEWGNLPISIRRGADRRAVERFIRANIMTTYHYAGTCKMGEVVDTELRVMGLEGLRVADASVVPFTPVSAMNAPSMVVGHRAAIFIRQSEHGAAPARPARPVASK